MKQAGRIFVGISLFALSPILLPLVLLCVVGDSVYYEFFVRPEPDENEGDEF